MNRAKICMMIAILAAALAALACNFSFSGARIEDAWMAFDQDGALRTGVYEQDDIFYAIVLLKGAPAGTEVKAIFYAADVEGEQPETRIDDASLISGSGQVYFTVSNPALWPPGGYQVDLYLNGEIQRSLMFEVRGRATPTPETTPTSEKAPAVAEPAIINAYTARDEAGEERTMVFKPEDVFYAKLEVVDAPQDALIRADWYAVEAEGIERDYLIDSAEISGGDNAYTFDLTGVDLWPVGTYKVELSINNRLLEALEFRVDDGSGPSATVTYAYLSADEDGIEATTIFSKFAVFYCIAEVAGSKEEDTIKAVWYAVNAPGLEANSEIYSSEIAGGAETYTFQLFSDDEWPIGLYAVELYIDGERQLMLEFQVE